MPSFFKNVLGGKAISGGALAPRSRRGNATDVVATYWFGSSKLDAPTLSAYSYGADGAFQFTITNYNSAYTYNLSSSGGTITRSTNTVTVSGLGNGATATAYVSADYSGFTTSDVASVVGQTKPACTSCGSGSSSVQGCNGATCGIISCSSGYCPAYNIVSYPSPTPNPCVGCSASVGGWYCCACGGACG